MDAHGRHTKRQQPSLCACPDCCDVLTQTQRTNNRRAFARRLFVQARFFRHSVLIRLFFETHRPIGFSSFPSIRRLPLTAPVKRRYRSLHPPASFSPFACLHYTVNGLTCQDFLTICRKNPTSQTRGADRWTFHVRDVHNPCKVGICAYIGLKKSPSAPLAKDAFRSSVSLCRQLLLLFRQVQERRLTLAPLALDA